MKPLVIYHASCADGFGAAFSAWLKLGDDAEYMPMNYLKPMDWFDPRNWMDREVYILDFSFPRDIMEDAFKIARKVVWLDHHKSIFDELGKPLDKEVTEEDIFGHPYEPHHIRLINGMSGAMIAWTYFHPGTEVPMFIRHIDDYDRWQFKIEGTKAFNKAIWSHAPWSFEQWRDWFYDVEDGFNHKYWAAFYIEGAAILRAHDANVQSVVKGGARPCSIVPAIINSSDSYKAPWVWWHDEECGDTCGANGLAANCPPHLASDVGHELANQSGTFGLLWSIDKDNVCRCSLRSNGDYDVSAIAKAFGGGGHRNAAGFQIDIQTLLGWLK